MTDRNRKVIALTNGKELFVDIRDYDIELSPNERFVYIFENWDKESGPVVQLNSDLVKYICVDDSEVDGLTI